MALIKISAVSYLNTKPFLYGLEHSGLLGQCELSVDIPSVCAEKLLSGAVDVGLVPVAVLPELAWHEIISDYCIGCEGAVHSVRLFSEVPVEKATRIYLDPQSRTSVLLTKILAEKHWGIAPEWEEGTGNYEQNISGTHAALVIGDRAFPLAGNYAYKYDLGEEWHRYTGLPFVFACWVANKPLPDEFKKEFDLAISYGVANKEKAVGPDEISQYATDVNAYFNEYISYELDYPKLQALDLFLSEIALARNVDN